MSTSTIRRFIAEYNRRHGATVLLTSHYMKDVAALCERVVVIAEGLVEGEQIVTEGTGKVRDGIAVEVKSGADI